mgnify:FL=1
MSVLRKIKRNKLKLRQQNNKIRKAWRSKQIEKYIIQGYCDLINKNNSKIKKVNGKKVRITRNKLTPSEAYMV